MAFFLTSLAFGVLTQAAPHTAPIAMESIGELMKRNVSFPPNPFSVNAPEPLKGPYEVGHASYTSNLLDSTDQGIEVFYPVGSGKHPFISYAHGFSRGGSVTREAYGKMLRAMAEWGYVIAAPRACNLGCADDRVNLPGDPPGFGQYYKQQLKTIEWARNILSPVHSLIDFSKGVGIAGHSMGGQATQFSSAYVSAAMQAEAERQLAEYDLQAAVLHHPYTHNFPGPAIPALIMTGSADWLATPAMSESIYDAQNMSTKAFVNKRGTGHHAVDVLAFDPLYPQYTVAWFKLYLDKTPQSLTVDWEELIFGSGRYSMCNGGFGDVVSCKSNAPTPPPTSRPTITA